MSTPSRLYGLYCMQADGALRDKPLRQGPQCPCCSVPWTAVSAVEAVGRSVSSSSLLFNHWLPTLWFRKSASTAPTLAAAILLSRAAYSPRPPSKPGRGLQIVSQCDLAPATFFHHTWSGLQSSPDGRWFVLNCVGLTFWTPSHPKVFSSCTSSCFPSLALSQPSFLLGGDDCVCMSHCSTVPPTYSFTPAILLSNRVAGLVPRYRLP